jgi:hypothetical protein
MGYLAIFNPCHRGGINIHYLTDANLLSVWVRVITRTVKKIKEQGTTSKTRLR